MSDTYTEFDPAGPTPGGDSAGEDQVGYCWYRRFWREVPDDGDGQYAVARVIFFAQQRREADRARTVLIQQVRYVLCRDLGDPNDSLTYTSVVERECGTRGAPADEEAAKLACELFDPAQLQWDGWPTSELPCLPSTYVFADTANRTAVAAYCKTHGDPFYTNALSSAEAALEGFACDRGRRWRFLIDDGTARAPQPRITDLIGVYRVLRELAEKRYYQERYDSPGVWRYHNYGRLHPLALERVPGDVETRTSTGQGPAQISQQWQVRDVARVGEDSPPQVVYLRQTVTLPEAVRKAVLTDNCDVVVERPVAP